MREAVSAPPSISDTRQYSMYTGSMNDMFCSAHSRLPFIVSTAPLRESAKRL